MSPAFTSTFIFSHAQLVTETIIGDRIDKSHHVCCIPLGPDEFERFSFHNDPLPPNQFLTFGIPRLVLVIGSGIAISSEVRGIMENEYRQIAKR